jgi:two-component sensor histidine kinase
VQWIYGLEAAARARGLDPQSDAKAPVAENMPIELRRVAESFNAMADRIVEREAALTTSLAENRALMLEMHHRIKNSLQVIQSYLALIRRSGSRSDALPLLRVEARVGVLAVAYRLALTPNGIRPIAVKPFLDEIIGATIAALRRPRQHVVCAIDWEGELVVDRAIPLGLGLIEALVVAFAAPDANWIGVRLAADADGLIEVKVESNGRRNDVALPEKLVRGLANQLGATLSTPRPGEIALWKFSA